MVIGRALGIVRKAQQVLQSAELLKILRSEISNEIAADQFNYEEGSIGQFAIEHDSRDSRDVVLRRKLDSGEEVVVSALLRPEVVYSDNESECDIDEGYWLPKEALMKVCVKKPGVSSILQFNCRKVDDGCDFSLDDVFLLPSAEVATVRTVYRGPRYEMLDRKLQFELEEFLTKRGVDEMFTSWLLLYLHKKEQGQYVDWLRKIETFVTPDTDLQAE